MKMIRRLDISRWFLVFLLSAILIFPLIADRCNAQVKASDFKLSIDLQTIGHLDFESQLKAAAQAGWPTVSLRMAKLEEYLKTGKTVEDAVALVKKYNLPVPQVGYFPFWINVTGKAQDEMLEKFRKFSGITAKFGNAIILLTTQCEGPQDRYDEALAAENFKKMCQIAAADGNQVGAEFLPFSPVDTVEKMWGIVKKANMPNGGIIIDPFHYFKGGSTLESLREVPIEKITAVHWNDLKDRNPDVDLITLTRSYRVMPGEGDFPLEVLLGYLFERGYSGYYISEVLNKDYVKEDPVKIATQARESLEKMLINYAQQRKQKK